jgi:hypothetical protein
LGHGHKTVETPGGVLLPVRGRNDSGQKNDPGWEREVRFFNRNEIIT